MLLDIQTVRRFADAEGLDELLAKSAERASKIDRYKPHLHRRWNSGVTDAARLTEITALGYTGSGQTVRRYLHRFRDARPAPPPGPVPPTVRATSRWIMTRPDRLDPDDQTALTNIQARCPELRRIREELYVSAHHFCRRVPRLRLMGRFVPQDGRAHGDFR